MSELRRLQFADLHEAAAEAQRLLADGYVPRGNWTLAQACRHLRLAQDPSVDGYPAWTSLFAFLRPVMRRLLLPRALSDDPPRGIRTMRQFEPGDDLEDAAEVEQFIDSIERFHSHPGDYHPHPAFGRMNRQQLEAVHAAHAAHHLRFLEPNSARPAAS